MDLQQEDVQFLSLTDILRESVSIPRRSPKAFNLITLALVFPLSFAILAHSLFTRPIASRLHDPDLPLQAQSHEWTLLFTFHILYLLFLFTFSLLSTAAVVFTVASIYSGVDPSSISVLLAVPSVFRRLLLTFLWVSLSMLLYHIAFVFLLLLLLVTLNSIDSPLLFLLALLLSFSLILFFLFVHVFITALWHLASVISVLEPFYGFSAMRKSYQLLKGKLAMASKFVFAYLFICGVINGVFATFVVNTDSESVLARVVVGGVLVAVLVVVNLVGLLVQSVFYYVCKSFHHQGIDKTALHDHLGGYLGEYVPLKSSIQMETLDI